MGLFGHQAMSTGVKGKGELTLVITIDSLHRRFRLSC